MTNSPQNIFGDDHPKENPWRHDKLGYSKFAKKISDVILNTHSKNGFVIGLHGKWGSGKSTTLNFIEAFLNKHNQETEDPQRKLIIIKFRPWIISGHQDLTAAFFKLLSEHLEPNDRNHAKRFRKLLRFFRGSSGGLVDTAASIALALAPSYGVLSKGVGAIAKKPFDNMIERFLAEPALQTAYESLAKQLKEKKLRFLVTIDDLDRLEEAEIRTIMQMVKTVGRLPYITYLLAYDRGIISKALDSTLQSGAPRFADKIIQQEVELPVPFRGSLLSLLDREINFLIGPTENSTRWSYLIRDGIHRWINSPRDVLRLSNAVKLSWPALRDEIDAQDLLAIEGLRLFDEIAFTWIRENRDFLFSQGYFLMSDEETKKAVIENLKNRLNPENINQLLHVISLLFPHKSDLIEGKKAFNTEAFIEVAKRRGIGCEAGYDAYFSFHPSADEIPKSTINRLLQNMDNIESIESIVTPYIGMTNNQGEPMIEKLMNEISSIYQSRDPSTPTQEFLNFLIKSGDDIIALEGREGMFIISPRTRFSFLIRDILKLWGSDDAGKNLITAFNYSRSPGACSEIFVTRGRELDIFGSNPNEQPVIGKEEFESLCPHLLTIINEAYENNTLHNAPFYFNILRAWGYLDSWEKPKLWIEKGISESTDFLVKVGKGLVSYSVGTEQRTYNMNELPNPEIYSLPTLISACEKHLNNPELSTLDRSLIKEIHKSSNKYLKNQEQTAT